MYELAAIAALTLLIIVSTVTILNKLEDIMAQLDDLKAAVAAETTVDQSAVTLLNGLAAQLSAALAASGQPNPDVQAVIDQMTANAAALSAAVTANTPAAPPTPAPAA